MGTGIVFVVLVAIWVAYFVQYWSRRREHVATARSVEAFSEAMRVLERRPPLRAAATDRISSAYSVSPARVVGVRPQVMAKPRPAPSPGGAPGMRTLASSQSSPSHSSAPSSGLGAPRLRPRHTAAGPVPSRKVRGLVLLGTLLATLVAAVLAPLTTLLWWVPLLGVVGVVASFFWLRAAVQAEIRLRRAARRSRPRRRPTLSSNGAREQHEDVIEPGAGREAELLEARTVTAAAAALDSTAAVDEDIDGWRPVPVPPPTYTLKAKAEYRPAELEDPVDSAVVEIEHTEGADPATEGSGEPQDAGRVAYGT